MSVHHHGSSGDGVYRLGLPKNEPIRAYRPGSPERAALGDRLRGMSSDIIDIPCIIGGKEVLTGDVRDISMPHDHGRVLARCHLGGQAELSAAAAAALRARGAWSSLPWHERVAVFLRAADLLSGAMRDTLNSATILGQSKTVHQAEVDAACELIDFFRFNAHFYRELLEKQPLSPPGAWNRLDYRPLEGFVLAITPFNFTAIAGNLPSAPALCGNAAVWKPSLSSVLSSFYIMRLLEAAGLPPGVINFVPAPGQMTAETLLPHPELAGVHFTGSTEVFQEIYRRVGAHIAGYKGYPRIVGETGGKDFIFVHASAQIEALVAATVRGAFEYQGQKCSAVSRMYVPASIWPAFRDALVDTISTISMGDPTDFTHFMSAVIDREAFDKIKGYIDCAGDSEEAEIICGGGCDDTVGYFVEPTVILTRNPGFRTMVEEIFGPVLTIFVYRDAELDEALARCDTGSPYALTGAVFATDRQAIDKISSALRFTAGNFYINDKPTGAVVGQQPFGGSRASGTNDKAGSGFNIQRWLSPRAIKETLSPPVDYRYPFMQAP